MMSPLPSMLKDMSGVSLSGYPVLLAELMVIFQLADNSFEERPDSSREISLPPRERERERERVLSNILHGRKKRNTKHYLMKSFIT